MSKLVLAASLLAALVLVACGAPTPPPSQPADVPPSALPVPPVPVTPATPEPTDPWTDPSPDPSAEPPAPTPAPTVRPTTNPTPKPRPTAPTFTRAERYLIDGIMRGESDCAPVRSSRLPADAIAGIDCDVVGSPVARVGYYLFGTDADMLDAYLARIKAEGIQLESGTACQDGDEESESAYIPWAGDDIAPYRHACFINGEGYGNYRVTVPGAHVYIGLLGRTDDMRSLEAWAFFGSVDTPGFPTLWSPPFEYRS